MLEPVLDEENRTVVTCLRLKMNRYQELWAIPEKIQSKQVAGVGEIWNFQGYCRMRKFQGSIKKRSGISTGVFTKNSCGMARR